MFVLSPHLHQRERKKGTNERKLKYMVDDVIWKKREI